MNKNSNTYTFLYATGIVLIVAIALAIAAMGLKDKQEKNIEIEKQQNILAAVNKIGKAAEIEAIYSKYIIEQFVVNGNGERKDGDAFSVDMKEQYDIIKKINSSSSAQDKIDLRNTLSLPVFVFKNDDGAQKYIVSLRGMGLWGAVWGYISLNDDFETIYGAIFDHKGETPGLGAEIRYDSFSSQFIGKTIFENGRFTSIKVVKGGAQPNDKHSIDAISGGTITSRGVEDMLKDCLGEYKSFFEIMKKQSAQTKEQLQEEIL